MDFNGIAVIPADALGILCDYGSGQLGESFAQPLPS
jgi:hypothetical protein